MFKFLKSLRKSRAALLGASSVDGSPQPRGPKETFLADEPIKSRSEDRFNRWPFAKRIADTVATRRDPASMVLGVFGPWGDGKTSLLAMMEEALALHPQVVVVRFNPWHFQTEDLLLRGFFATLADALDESLPSVKEKAGELLKKYGNVLSLASVTVGGLVRLAPGDAVKGVGDAMSTVGLDALRKRVETMLREADRRIVVLVDDIDRLDRHETHAIFKLVKLSASFEHTAYVLAFDDDVVAAALGERYGAGGALDGRAFLEKIIQVPLHLPPADRAGLREIALKGVQTALDQADIELTQQQADAFVRRFDDALLPQIRTPRRAKLLTNAVLFALPLLKGEVDPVELMLLEGVRVLYPSVYAVIRENKSLFLMGEGRETHGLSSQTGRITELLEQATPSLTLGEREVLRSRLLEALFPRIGSMGYGSEWDGTWSAEQRIASREYFDRFFTYSIPLGDLSDREVAEFCEQCSSLTSKQLRDALLAFSDRHALPRMVQRLRQKAASMTPAHASALITAITENGDLLPRERGVLVVADTASRGSMLVADLLRQIPGGQQRQAEAERAIAAAQPLGFAMECIRWIRHNSDRPEERRVLTDDGEMPLREILVARIEAIDQERPVFSAYPKDAPSLYWAWSERRTAAVVGDRLCARFNSEPGELDAFLSCYVGEAWGMDSGLSHAADFDRENYDAVTRLVPSGYIADNLVARYGSVLLSPERHPAESMPQALRIAHQYMAIHRKLTG